MGGDHFEMTLVALLLLLLCIGLSLCKLNDPLAAGDVEVSSQKLSELKETLSRRRLDSSSTCNLTRYNEWLNEPYIGVLAPDSAFWMYQTQPQIVLNNYFALNLAVRSCVRYFENLYFYRSGRMGPITIQDSYKIMCREYCLESDVIHQTAMNVSSCSCLELSTQPDEVAYTKEGDWCRHNTGHLLCGLVGYCGVWNCRIDDFMCPRYEWNKKVIPLKGPGTCIRGAASRSIDGFSSGWLAMLLTGVATVLSLYFG